MADVPAADDDDNGYQPARQRPSRGLSRKNHQSTNNIKAEDVISVASKLVVMSTEAAKALNPQLGDTDAMDTEARDDAHKFFSVHKRPIGATVSSSRSYTHTTGFHLSYVRYDQAKPAALFATEASVTNAFVRGGIDEKNAEKAQREIRGKTCNRVSVPRRGHIRGCACGRVYEYTRVYV